MSETTTFFNQQLMSIMLSINTAFPAEVLAFDEATSTAKIQPKFQVKEVGKAPQAIKPIEGVPALTQRYKIDGVVKELKPVLQRGDIVQVVCNQRALDNALTPGKTVYAGTLRLFSVHDAVIIGVIK